MGTSVNEVYCLNDLMRQWPKLSLLPINKYYELMFRYLKFAIGEFEAKCYKSLKLSKNFYQHEYTFYGNGTDNELVLSPLPPEDSLLYIGYRDIGSKDVLEEITEYEYDAEIRKITLPCPPSNTVEIYISAYIIGEFEEELCQKEINILALGCLVPFNLQKLENNNIQEQRVFSQGVTSYSQAAHIQAVTDAYDTIYYKTLKREIKKYTREYSPDNYDGLTGKA